MSPLQATTEPFRDLVDESFDEAAFLWQRWESELTSLTRNLDEIWSWTEERLHGALDGIHVGGASGLETAAAAIGSDELDRVTVGAGVLASSTEPSARDVLSAALKDAQGEKLRAMMRALELLGTDRALRGAARVLAVAGPDHAAALCRLKAFRRVAPGDELTAALKAATPDARIDALRALRFAPPGTASESLIAALKDSAPAVRYAAVETGMCLRNSDAWDTAMALARKGNPDSAPYLNLVALFGSPEEHEIVYRALRTSGLQVPAIWALGHIGTARAADACLAGMKHETFARACGEAYAWMTGADLERDGLAVQEIPDDAPAFENDDLDANLVPAPEALWPLPDADAIQKHWLALRPNWAPDVRYLRGQPMNGDTLLTAIERGPMLRRPDLVLELAVKTRGRYDVETRAFTARQRQMMTAARASAVNHSGH